MKTRATFSTPFNQRRSKSGLVKEFQLKLANSGHPWSDQREQIVMAVLSQQHITIQEIYWILKSKHPVSLATISRTLRIFCKVGIVRKEMKGIGTSI
jgi:Fe2+ or Zn2+ uptake regulation protein